MIVLKDVEMKEYSNMKIGGIGRELIIVEDKAELHDALNGKKDIFVIGNGTNTLLNDGRLEKTFVSLKKLQKIEELGEGLVRVEAGIDFNELVDYTGKMDYNGLENLSGIPGSLGGLVYMNGGAYGSEIFDHIVEIEILDNEFNLRTVKKENMYFTYRKTEIQEKKWIVVSATFKFDKGFDNAKVEELRTKREGNHPLDLPNLGSTFKNPEGMFSARLIIEAGMQGIQIGGAQISMKHPNFVVNHGNAKFEDVINLVTEVKKAVKEKSGVDLHEEIIIVK
ncbi:MAG: UDP-N-acetylmuramate dehydrogenase [Fusobacteriaceae bacterium]|nr:UDP-N-acetylmuramate dehydrogenase [Fusobacteriaceae bacterium]MBP9596218.1 UDP-N-acetylmuramate dehydrogenase [Fusobacteriaceae bacterium]